MIFKYIDLPRFPDKFISVCMDNIDLIDNDPTLSPLNDPRGPANSATWLPSNANDWIIENISKPFFPNNLQLQKNNLMNVSFYAKRQGKPQYNGNQGKHRDIGRRYALNYYLTLGGNDVKTKWYDDEENLLYEENIKPFKWCLLKVDGLHSVTNIKLGQLRTFISLDINDLRDLNKFNEY